MKHPQTKFHAHSMRGSQVIRSRKSQFIIRSKFIVGSKLSCNTVFFLLIYILSKLQQQILICFWKF